MVKDAKRLAEFEREQAGRAEHRLTYEQALRLVESLWAEARALGSVAAGEPLRDLDADIEVARTLNARRRRGHV